MSRRATWRAFFWFTSASYIDKTLDVAQPPRFKVHARMEKDRDRIVCVEVDADDVAKIHGAAAEFLKRTGRKPLEQPREVELAGGGEVDA